MMRWQLPKGKVKAQTPSSEVLYLNCGYCFF